MPPKPIKNLLEEARPKRTRRYCNEIFEKLLKEPDLQHLLIMNAKNNTVKSTMNSHDSIQYSGIYGSLLDKSRYFIQLLDSSDTVLSLRVRTTHHEIFVQPDEHITIVVMQEPIDRIERNY